MPTRSSDLAVCAATLRQGSRSFAAASLLLPGECRGHAMALYGFCRQADDAIDHAPPQHRIAVIDHLHAQLNRAVAGQPENTPIARSFAHALAECAIPAELPRALLEGFAWDAEARRYATLSDLRAYAARVAGTVGAMMALVMGVRDPDAVARACDLGVAMQLTNIARDVGEDARAGRLYLPLDWLHAAGVDSKAFLAQPGFSPAIADCVARLLTEAEMLYARASTGIAALPLTCRPAIRAALALYREIGRQLLRSGGNSVDSRTIVSAPRKLALVLRCLAPAGARDWSGAALAETAFLLNAVPRLSPAPRLHPVVWVLDLFAQLEQRDQLRSLG
jgi:phytoene synthase